MSLPRLALCLALLAPCVGFAQAPERPPPASAPSEPGALPPPPLITAPEEPEVPEAPEAPEEAPPEGELFPRELGPPEPPGHVFGRVALSVLGGGAGGLGLGIASAFLAAGLFAESCSGDSLECLVPISLMGGTGAVIGVSLGVYGAGTFAQGRGQYWPTLVGSFLGAGLGILTAFATRTDALVAISLISGPIIGAIVGYELSHATQRSRFARAAADRRSRFELTPSLGFTPRGGLVGGLVGRF